MRTLFVALFFFLSFKGLAQIESDKVLHFAGGTLYGLAGAGIAKQISKGNRFWTFAGAIGGSALVGLGKEAIDSNPNGTGWDNGDLIATILGGAAVGITIDIFTNHKNRKKTKPQGGLTVEIQEHVKPVKIRTNRLPSLSELGMPSIFLD